MTTIRITLEACLTALVALPLGSIAQAGDAIKVREVFEAFEE